MTSNISIRGWEVPAKCIPNIELNFPYDLFEDPSHNFAVFMYNIDDIRMATPVGRIRILTDKRSPVCIDENNDNANFIGLYYGSNTIQWFEDSSVFMVRIFYGGQEPNVTNCPILLLDYKKKCFACIKTENDHSILEVSGINEELFLLRKEKWTDNKRKDRTIVAQKVVNFENLSWYPFPVTNIKIHEIIGTAYSF